MTDIQDIGAHIATFLELRDVVRLSEVSKDVKRISDFELERRKDVDPLVNETKQRIEMPGYEDPWIDADWDTDFQKVVEKHFGGQTVLSFQEYREKVLWPRVRAAYLHMVKLVRTEGMEGERDQDKKANLEAKRVYGVFFGGFRNDCAAVVLKADNPGLLDNAELAVALNSTTLLSDSFDKLSPSNFNNWRRVKFRLENKYGEPDKGYLVIAHPECSYMHAEIRLWEAYGDNPKLNYIGIQQPCCLFCAAQLLAAGFKGFPGCHMDVYKQYTFSPKILARPLVRKRLFGDEVAAWYAGASARERADFLRELAEADKIFSNDKFRQQDRRFNKVSKQSLSEYEPGHAESSEDESEFEKKLEKNYPLKSVKERASAKKRKQPDSQKKLPGPREPKNPKNF